MFTKNGKWLTAKGIKPVCIFQKVFKSLYLFGAFSPITDKHFELEMPYCNTDTFQIFLEKISEINPTELKIMLLDNGAFHKAERLVVPENTILLFIPPYSPELNTSEKIWRKMKRAFTGKLHKTLDNASEFITNEVNILTKSEVKSICGFEYLFSCDYWTKTY